jgi:ubiquinone/menaquinone biosynthesis C-methylase UbiE
MRSVSRPCCPICDSPGKDEYFGLEDGLYGTPGLWNMKKCQRKDCGALWLDPMPHSDDLSLAYQGYYTHSSTASVQNALARRTRDALISVKLGYPQRQPLQFRLASRLLNFSARRTEDLLHNYFYLRWRPSGRLLEIGCGAGEQLLTLKNAGWDVIGVDFDPAAVAAARSRGLTVVLGDLRDANFDSDSFDAVVMSHVIEHVVDPVSLLAECRRVLKPQGAFVTITPNAKSWGHRTFRASWRGLEPPRHLTVFTPCALRLAIKTAGMVPTRTHYSARDAANLLATSVRLRGLARGEQLTLLPRAAPSRWLRGMELIERLSGWMRIPLAEEQVQFATK